MPANSFLSPPDHLNTNYAPLRRENLSLQFYFKKSFALLEKNFTTGMVLSELLDEYLKAHAGNTEYGRVIKQKTLAHMIQSQIDLDHPQDLQKVFEVLNQSGNEIFHADDLKWLLSAYFSVFPFLFAQLTNPIIKNSLTICDINIIYYHTILERSLFSWASLKDNLISDAVIEVAFLTGQFESLLEKLMKRLIVEEKEEKTGLSWMIQENRMRNIVNNMHRLAKYAKPQQVEEIILPAVMSVFNDIDNLNFLYKFHFILNALSPILKKLSNEIVEAQLVPKLLAYEFANQDNTNLLALTELLSQCIEKLTVDELKRSMFPALFRYSLTEQKENSASDFQKGCVSKLVILTMSKIPQLQLNDETAGKFIAQLKSLDQDYVLKILKNIRNKNLNVNEKILQAVLENVWVKNNAYLRSLKMGESHEDFKQENLLHVTADQIEIFFRDICLEKMFELNGDSFLDVLDKFAQLPKEIFPEKIRMQVFDFLFKHLDHKTVKKDNFLSVFASYLQQMDFSKPTAREILIEQFHLVSATLKEAREYNPAQKRLFDVCVALMTEQELIEHVVPLIDAQKIHVADSLYLCQMSQAFEQVFSKINDPEVYGQFFQHFMILKLKMGPVFCDDILQLMINKVRPEVLAYACNTILKSEVHEADLGRTAAVLAIFYKHNKETMPIPACFLKYHDAPSEALSSKILGREIPVKTAPERGCTLM